MRVWAIWSVKSGSVGNTRLLSRAKMLLVSLRTADVSRRPSPLRDVSRNVPQKAMSEEKRLPAFAGLLLVPVNTCIFSYGWIMLWRGLHFDWANYVIFAAYFMLACSQTLYFLFEVRRAPLIKYKPQGIYDGFEKNEKKNKTTSVYSLVSCWEVVTSILIFWCCCFWSAWFDDLPFTAAK